MSRTMMDISISGYTDDLDSRIRQVLIAEHYKEIDYYREVVWKKGTGMMTAMHYIKVEYPDYQTVRLSGWVQIGIGSVGGKERDLSGITGIIPKKSVQNTMNAVQSAILQFDRENPAQYGYVDPEAEAINTEKDHIYDAAYTDVEPKAFQPEQTVPTLEETAPEPVKEPDIPAPQQEPELQSEPVPETTVPAAQAATAFVMRMPELPTENTPEPEETVPLQENPAETPAPQQETGFVMVMEALPSAAEPKQEVSAPAEEEIPAQSAPAPEALTQTAEPEQTAAAEADTASNPFRRAVRPCGDNFNSDRKYLLWLCGASFAGALPQGENEYFALDTRTEQPYYILSHRGLLPGDNRYEIKEPITWEELDHWGDAAQKNRLGTDNDSWKESICAVQTDAEHLTVLWRKNDRCLEEASISRKNDGFTFAHSEKSGFNDPTAKGTRNALTPRQYRSETTFRIAVQSKISKEYVVQLLWEFLKESLQSQPGTEQNPEPAPVEEQRYQADQAFQRGGLDREQAYGQHVLQPDGTPMEQNSVTPEPAAQEPEQQEIQPEERPMPVPANQPPKKIIFCQNCGCKLKIPDKKVKLHVVCPKCKFDFYYKD